MTRNESNPMQLKATMNQIGEPRLGSFAMVSDEALAHLDLLIKENPHAARLLTKLVRYLPSGSGGVVVMSRQTVCELMECSLSSAGRSISVLKSGGWIQTIRVSGAYAFAINARVAWRGERDGIQHAVFYATVIASRSEQDADFDANITPKTVPISRVDEEIIVTKPLAKPPSQMRMDGMEPSIQAELEARGQLRLGETNPETGEIL